MGLKDIVGANPGTALSSDFHQLKLLHEALGILSKEEVKLEQHLVDYDILSPRRYPRWWG